MTGRTLLALLLALPLIGLACGPRTDGLDTSKIPDDFRADYQLFATRCSKCHSLARPLTANISDDQQWVMYVNRMRRQPGSGISYDDQAHILRFLRWYASDLRRRDAEKRGLPAPTGSASAAAPASPVAQDGGL